MGLTLLAAGAMEKVFASNLPRVSPHHPHFGGGCDLGLSRGFVLVLHKAGATGREQEIESDKFDVGVCAHRQCVKVQTERRSLSAGGSRSPASVMLQMLAAALRWLR